LRPEGVSTYAERKQTAVEKIRDKNEEIYGISTLNLLKVGLFPMLSF
jgi:hypothetical protein